MLVKAKKVGEYPLYNWRQPGDKFEIKKELFSEIWMESLEPEDEKPEPKKPDNKPGDTQEAPEEVKAKPNKSAKPNKGK